jgi:DNA-binding CsgD family transcriptional regulator
MIGALIGLSLPVPIRIVGVVMGFRVQVLISAVAFELTGAAYDRAGPVPAVRGLSAGALTFLRRRLGDSATRRSAGRPPCGPGASGFLLKDVRPEQLAEAVRVVAAGETLLAPAITERLVQRLVGRPRPGATKPHELKSLTERELAVLILMARGRSNAEIASALFLSETTVKSHVTTCSANSLCAIGWRVLALSSVGAARTAGARDQFWACPALTDRVGGVLRLSFAALVSVRPRTRWG